MAVGLDYLRSGNMASLVPFLRVSRSSVVVMITAAKEKNFGVMSLKCCTVENVHSL